MASTIDRRRRVGRVQVEEPRHHVPYRLLVDRGGEEDAAAREQRVGGIDGVGLEAGLDLRVHLALEQPVGILDVAPDRGEEPDDGGSRDDGGGEGEVLEEPVHRRGR
jgi:hypothetical protein